ncbi:hypothetical protein HYX13_03585 [Candidatus Woesearchaeota archaeon]|nr:hypothetical protein [Candidatus Woesearchaeota archaeon]
MTHPVPKYKEPVYPFSLLGDGFQTVTRRAAAYTAFLQYISTNTYRVPSLSKDLEQGETFDQITGITKDSIVIFSSARTARGPEGAHSSGRVPDYWQLEVFSFQTPVDEVKRELERIIKESKV